MDFFISLILFFYESLSSVTIDGVSLIVFIAVFVLGGELVGIIVQRLVG